MPPLPDFRDSHSFLLTVLSARGFFLLQFALGYTSCSPFRQGLRLPVGAWRGARPRVHTAAPRPPASPPTSSWARAVALAPHILLFLVSVPSLSDMLFYRVLPRFHGPFLVPCLPWGPVLMHWATTPHILPLDPLRTWTGYTFLSKYSLPSCRCVFLPLTLVHRTPGRQHAHPPLSALAAPAAVPCLVTCQLHGKVFSVMGFFLRSSYNVYV